MQCWITIKGALLLAAEAEDAETYHQGVEAPAVKKPNATATLQARWVLQIGTLRI